MSSTAIGWTCSRCLTKDIRSAYFVDGLPFCTSCLGPPTGFAPNASGVFPDARDARIAELESTIADLLSRHQNALLEMERELTRSRDAAQWALDEHAAYAAGAVAVVEAARRLLDSNEFDTQEHRDECWLALNDAVHAYDSGKSR